jgi:NDP-sugar pyrophosphorylase family protein
VAQLNMPVLKSESDKFIVLNGDTYCELNYSDFIEASAEQIF